MLAASSHRKEGVLDTTTAPASASAPQPTTENQAGRDTSEISSLANYMARMQDASSAPAAAHEPTGVGSPNTAAPPQPQDGREQFIPRSRFDEVLAERNALRQQQMQVPQPGFAPQQQYQTGMQPMPYQQVQQGYSPTGMVGQVPQQQQAAQIPDFDNAKVQAEWRDKIVNNPVTGLRDLVKLMVMSEGAPFLEQFRQQIIGQLAPIQQTFVQSQLSTYANQRQQADPSFSQIAPVFNQLVGQAVQRGYGLTPQVLSAIEGIARAQAGMLSPQQAPRQVPFSEAPGGAAGFGQQSAGPNLTQAQLAVAKRFNMTPAEYAASLRSYGGS
jgi:hypothetical protein